MIMNYLKRIMPLIAILLVVNTGCNNNKNRSKEGQSLPESIGWKVIGPDGGGGVFLPTISPFDENLVFTHCDMTGAYVSSDGGKNWRMFNLWTVPVDFAFDPEVKGRVWSVWANAHDLPRDKMFGSNEFDRYLGGVAVSEDDGRTWRKSNTGLPENSVCTNILIDPDSPADSRTLYVSIFDKGVYKSVNGGNNWKEVNNGFGDNLFAW